MKPLEPLIYDLGSPGREGVKLPAPDVPVTDIPKDLLRDDLDLPEVAELDVVRHFTRLSRLNVGIDTTFYPLGSCTMKYNPRINEDMARLPGFAYLHPHSDEHHAQGALAVMWQLQEWLREIVGFAACSLQPAAGAQGEFAGILMIRAYHKSRGDEKRTKIIVPSSAHGTNPATTAMAGLQVVEIEKEEDGTISIEKLKAICDDSTAGMMITVPNTLGLFDHNIKDMIQAVHDCGGLMYMDGANMNALMGAAKPGELGFDVMHYNLHKTFSTPHGGGGPGSGPVCCNETLMPFLPGPVVKIVEEAQDEEDAPLYGFVMPEKSIGRLKAFHGNFGMLIRAFTYIRAHGAEGIKNITRHAVLNANYIRVKLQDTYKVPYNRLCGHEVVMEGHVEGSDVHALDISKRLMDYGIHPPTNYFPLIVHEALLIEPTETESIQMLDYFIETMKTIAQEAKDNPQLLKEAPHTAPVKRVDEVKAAKDLVLCCRPVGVTESAAN